jgi:hypothetical protein
VRGEARRVRVRAGRKGRTGERGGASSFKRGERRSVGFSILIFFRFVSFCFRFNFYLGEGLPCRERRRWMAGRWCSPSPGSTDRWAQMTASVKLDGLRTRPSPATPPAPDAAAFRPAPPRRRRNPGLLLPPGQHAAMVPARHSSSSTPTTTPAAPPPPPPLQLHPRPPGQPLPLPAGLLGLLSRILLSALPAASLLTEFLLPAGIL